MSAAKHTPGPWLVAYEKEGAFDIEAPGAGHAGGTLVLCSRSYHHARADEMFANGKLIAAAPELLHTVRALHFLCNALMGELGIEPETTEFNFTADGKPLARMTAGEFMRGADKVIAKATP